MIINNVLDLNARSVTLFSYDPGFLDRLCRAYLPDVDIAVHHVGVDSEYLAEFPSAYAYTPMELRNLARDWPDLRSEVAGLSALVVNGGGYFNDLWAKPHRVARLLSIMMPVLAAADAGVPTFFTGNSYGPFTESADLHAMFFGALEGAVLGCRDTCYSSTWLRALGVDTGSVVSLPDDLLFLNERLTLPPQARPEPLDPYVILETYAPLEDLAQTISLVKDFADTLRRRWGLQLVFLPFSVGSGGMEQGLFLRDKIPDIRVVDIRETGYLPIETATSVIGGAEFVLSMRYHAQVLAVAHQVPSLSILRPVAGDRRYYYNKNVGLLRQVFGRSNLDESDYLHVTMAGALDDLSRDLKIRSSRQRERFDEGFSENLLGLNQSRMDFLRRVPT